MKKILIAAFAVLAAASAAGAGEIKVNFDGDNGGFGQSFVESGFYWVSVATVSCGGVEYPANDFPLSCGGPSFPFGAIEESVLRGDKLTEGADAGMLARIYIAQPELKEALAEYFKAAGDEVNAGLAEKKQVRVMADRNAVYLAWNAGSVKIDNPALAGRVYSILYPAAAARQLPENKLLVEAAIVGAIGDGVSAVSEWLHS